MTQQDMSTQPERAETTPTRFVNVGEVRLAYRCFGNPAGTPLVFLQHFRGSMDNWDPALLNGFAQDRTVITFDNAGWGSPVGTCPTAWPRWPSTRLPSSTRSGSSKSICWASRLRTVVATVAQRQAPQALNEAATQAMQSLLEALHIPAAVLALQGEKEEGRKQR